MSIFLERYENGECEQVWRDLLAMGEKVREEPVFDDAMAVAREFAGRAWHNTELIYRRVTDLGFKFARPDCALVSASPQSRAWAERIEHELGTLPLSVRAWYERFDSLDFRQDKEQLKPPGTSPICGLGSHACLIMASPKQVCERWSQEKENYPEFYEKEHKFWFENYGRILPLEPMPFLESGGTASNCESKGFRLPALDADACLYDDGGGDTYFVEEIRRCFKWGGFPFCGYYLAGNAPLSWEARPDAERLVPLLREGLLPL